MSSPPPNVERTCPECQATLPSQARYCWLCGRGTEPGASAGPSPASRVDEGLLHVGSLVLPALVAVVCTGVFLQSPGLGTLLAVVLAPAVVRLLLVSARARLAGRPMQGGDKFEVFASTAGIMLAVGLAVSVILIVATVVAFLQMCWGGCEKLGG